MTPHPVNPLTSRKDIETWISRQTDIPCLMGGCGTESVLAFLMQLYAYVVSNFRDEIGASPLNNADAPLSGTELLKQHLMSSGRYQVVIYTTDFRARPNALQLRQRPAIYNGASMGSWIVLWPGAERDTFFKTGRVVSAVNMEMAKCHLPMRREDRGEANIDQARHKKGERRYAPSTSLKLQRPVRLIPP